MLLLKIDPTPGHIADHGASTISTAPNLPELIQLRRDREHAAQHIAHDRPLSQMGRDRSQPAGELCEYRDDDLISVLNLGEEFLVFVTDDGQSPYLFRIVVEASKIGSVLTGGQVGSGELSVARFAANGVMTWLPLPRAIRSTIYETAGQLGATILGPVDHTRLSPDAKFLRLTLRLGEGPAQQPFDLLSVDLCPPRIGDQHLWHARRYSWHESDQPPPAQSDAIAVNDNETAAALSNTCQ